MFAGSGSLNINKLFDLQISVCIHCTVLLNVRRQSKIRFKKRKIYVDLFFYRIFIHNINASSFQIYFELIYVV